MIKVLWIDDQPNNAFIDNADNAGIYIEVCENVDAGIDELVNSANSYDAIILDANCISHNYAATVPDISALSYALRKITEKQITLPWFVYSGGGFSGEESIDISVSAYERAYDKKSWYKKPVEMDALFAKIKQVVPESNVYKIKEKYSEIFSYYPYAKELVDILTYLEKKEYNKPSVFNLIRKALDWIMEHLYNCGMLLKPYEKTKLTDSSKFLTNEKLLELVPLHIQRSFHSTTSICNEGSHRLVIDKLVKEGKAPYLVQSTVLEFLNILYWLKDMPETPEGREHLKVKVEELLAKNGDSKDEYEGKDFVIEQDEKNNFHCGQCRLSYKAAMNYKGQTVTLYEVTENDAKSKDNYPFFAKFRLKEQK